MADDSPAEPTTEPPAPVTQGGTDARIAEIVEMMRDFTFVRGKTAKELAAKWGLSLNYVHELTAKASKLVKAGFDNEAIAAEVVPGLLKAFRTAASSEDPKSLGAVAPIGNLIAEIHGMKQPRKHELTGAGGSPMQLDLNVDVRTLTDEQLAALAGRPAPGAGGTSGAGATSTGSPDGSAAGVHPGGDAEVVAAEAPRPAD